MLLCLARDTYACIMLQIHCGFTTILCLGSGQVVDVDSGCVSGLCIGYLERDRCLL